MREETLTAIIVIAVVAMMAATTCYAIASWHDVAASEALFCIHRQ